MQPSTLTTLLLTLITTLSVTAAPAPAPAPGLQAQVETRAECYFAYMGSACSEPSQPTLCSVNRGATVRSAFSVIARDALLLEALTTAFKFNAFIFPRVLVS